MFLGGYLYFFGHKPIWELEKPMVLEVWNFHQMHEFNEFINKHYISLNSFKIPSCLSELKIFELSWKPFISWERKHLLESYNWGQNYHNLCHAKGQIKPKAVWAHRRFSQKTNKWICFVCREKQKSKQTNSFACSFFGRIYSMSICFWF